MAAIYKTYGPFDLKRDEDNGNKLAKGCLAELWKTAEDVEEGISSAFGVYIFAVKNGKTSKPWYVGKTIEQQFKTRFAQHEGTGTFRRIFDTAKNGTPQVFLLARRTPTNTRFAKVGRKLTGWNDSLESMMIGSCLRQNKELINLQKVKHLKEMQVPGYLNNKRKMNKAASALAQMLGSN